MLLYTALFRVYESIQWTTSNVTQIDFIDWKILRFPLRVVHVSHGNPEGVLSGAPIPGKHIELGAWLSWNARSARYVYWTFTNVFCK